MMPQRRCVLCAIRNCMLALVLVKVDDDGGAAVVAGTLSASGILGTISQAVTFATTPVYGDAALLLVALVLLRLLPQGITGRFFTRST